MRTIKEDILSHIPALTMSAILIWPDAYAIVFGGVATGIIKAQLAPSVAGIINRSGSCPRPRAVAPNIGINVDAVAVLEVNSVNIIIMATLNNTIKIIEIVSKLLLKAPIQAANPDELITLASARPPPINIKAPHGIF